MCGRTAAEVAKVFEDDIAQAKEKALAGAKVGENEPNHVDVYTEAEYELAKACQELAAGLLSTPLDQYEEQRESLSAKYKGMDMVEQLVRLPKKKNPIAQSVRNKNIGDRVKEIVGTYEKAREVDRVRSEKRQKIEESYNALPEQVEWMRRLPVRLTRSGMKESPQSLRVEVSICVACAAWEPDLSEAKNRQCPP